MDSEPVILKGDVGGRIARLKSGRWLIEVWYSDDLGSQTFQYFALTERGAKRKGKREIAKLTAVRTARIQIQADRLATERQGGE